MQKSDNQEKDEYKQAFNYCIRLLSSRDYSTYKMKLKLSDRNFKLEVIDHVITKLLEYNYLRENEYKMMRVKQLIVRGFANAYIIKKLSHEKLSVEDIEIESLRDEQNLSSEKQIDYLIEKKLRYKEIPTEFNEKMKFKNKVISFLISKGYSFEKANQRLGFYNL